MYRNSPVYRNFVAAIVSLGIIGCSSDDPSGPLSPGGSMSARIDGANWTAQSLSATYIGTVLFVSGSNGTATINITVTALGTGTYDLTEGSTSGSIVVGGNTWYAVGEGGSGSVTITSLNSGGATGTFSITGGPLPGSGTTGTRSVTNGAFNVTY